MQHVFPVLFLLFGLWLFYLSISCLTLSCTLVEIRAFFCLAKAIRLICKNAMKSQHVCCFFSPGVWSRGVLPTFGSCGGSRQGGPGHQDWYSKIYHRPARPHQGSPGRCSTDLLFWFYYFVHSIFLFYFIIDIIVSMIIRALSYDVAVFTFFKRVYWKLHSVLHSIEKNNFSVLYQNRITWFSKKSHVLSICDLCKNMIKELIKENITKSWYFPQSQLLHCWVLHSPVRLDMSLLYLMRTSKHCISTMLSTVISGRAEPPSIEFDTINH